MAIVNLKDVKVYATFSKGFRVVEESKGRDGKDYSTRWTVWSDTIRVNEGNIVSLSGFLGAKVNDWTDKEGQTRHSVELSINSPRLAGEDAKDSSQPVQSRPQPAAPDVWNAPSNYSDETPF